MNDYSAATVAPARSYQAVRSSIDLERLKKLEGFAPVDPIDQSPHQVRASSRGLGVDDLLVVWEELGPEQEQYLRPNSQYNIFVRLKAPKSAVQYRAGVLDVRQPMAGEVVIVPPYTAAYFRDCEASHSLHISVSQELLVKASGNLYSNADPRMRLRNSFGSDDSVVPALSKALLQEAAAGKASARNFFQFVGTGIAIHLLSEYAEKAIPAKGKLSPAQLSRVNDYLENHMADKISIEEIAKLLAMSPYQFSKMFHATVGTPPLRYSLQLRLSRARMLIESTKRSIGEIAADMGFLDLSHFSKLFRKYWGMPPSKFRTSGGKA